MAEQPALTTDPAQASSAKPDEPVKSQDPVHVWDELTRHKEGDNGDFEDRFISNYFFVPFGDYCRMQQSPGQGRRILSHL